MAITLLGNNLITDGDHGTFEADPSSWGFGLSFIAGSLYANTDFIRKAALSYEGYYSFQASLNALYTTPFQFFHDTPQQVLCSRFFINAQSGKKYIFKARVRTDLLPIGDAGTLFAFYYYNKLNQLNKVQIDFAETHNEPISNCIETWQEITFAFTALASQNIGLDIVATNNDDNFMDYNASGTVFTGRNAQIDQVEAYEYTDIVGPEELTFDQVYFSRNPIPHTVPAVTLPGENFVNANGRVLAEQTQGDEDYVEIFRQNTEPVNDEIIFRLKRVVDANLALSPPQNVVGTIDELTDRIKRFQFEGGKTKDDEEEPPVWNLTETALVIKGGISTVKFPGFDFFGAYYNTNRPFLTWQQNNKKVLFDQEEFVYFFVNNPAVFQLKLNANIYYDDGTSVLNHEIAITDQDFADTNTTIKGRLFVFPAGRENTNIHLVTPAKNISYYEIFLKSQTGFVFSEVRKYFVEYLKPQSTEYFLFANSVSGFDSLAAVGKTTDMMEATKDLFERTNAADYTLQDPELNVLRSRFMDSFKSNSGYLKNKQDADYLAHELLNSERVVLLVNKQRIPVVITTSKATISTDENYKWFVEFDYQIAFTNFSYTPINA